MYSPLCFRFLSYYYYESMMFLSNTNNTNTKIKITKERKKNAYLFNCFDFLKPRARMFRTYFTLGKNKNRILKIILKIKIKFEARTTKNVSPKTTTKTTHFNSLCERKHKINFL